MAQELMIEKWSGKIPTVTIGATKAEGGTRTHSVKIGGEESLPCLAKEGLLPNRPQVAFEIWDTPPTDWPDELNAIFGNYYSSPIAWAKACVEKYKAKSLCVRLQSAHPDSGNKSPEQIAQFVKDLLGAVGVPLVIIGCGDNAKDNLILPAASEAAKGERCLVGCALQDNYKTLVAAVSADGHNIIAESPIDINIAKQLNILISDMGLPLERIVINPTIGALGYGLEYAYSIMERARLAALSADKTLACPFICFVGQESWHVKEARAAEEEFPAWGKVSERGIIWEVLTSTALIQAGADLLVMRHPLAVEKINKYIEELG